MTQETLHVVGLPHTQTTAEWSNCAFTANVRGFVKMMKSLDYTVVLYGSEDYDVPVDEFVSCISRQEQHDLIGVDGPDTVLNANFDGTLDPWPLYNDRVAKAIAGRADGSDFVCLIGGEAHTALARSIPDLTKVEFAVGMSGIIHEPNVYRVWADYNWMHIVTGRYWGAHGTQGRPYDRVIPHYIDPDEFIYLPRGERDDYFLFVGRLNEDKGIGIAIDVARATGRKLVVAGQGMPMPEDVDYRGRIGPVERAALMSRAACVLVPSLYIEPFGMVAIEGLISGAPLITTDFGGPAEINIDGVTGFKCHSTSEFIRAGTEIDRIDPADCRKRGLRYSTETVKHEYDKFFTDLAAYIRGGSDWHFLQQAVPS